MKRTRKDLERSRREYARNWELLLNSLGTPQQDKYVKEEARLDLEQTAIMRELGLIVGTCSAGMNKHCTDCSGYIKQVTKQRMTRYDKMGSITIWVECNEGDEGCTICELSNEALTRALGRKVL